MGGLFSVERICTIVGAVCAGYLLLRLIAVALRVRWARRAYPLLADDQHQPCDRGRGALLGLAIGDALCVPAESLPRWLVRLRYPKGPAMRRGLVRVTRRAGDVSDDTQLTISVANSIDPHGEYLHQRFVDEFRIWYGYRIGAGRACSVAARKLADPKAQLEGVAFSLPSEGNGAAMRVAPLAIAAGHGEWSEAHLISAVRQNAGASHQAEAAITAAVFVALLVRHALGGDLDQLDADGWSRIFASAAQRSGFSIARFEEARDGADSSVESMLGAIGTSGHVFQSVNAALAILLRCGEFEQAMGACFWAGGDTDSVAAIVGAVLGARTGCEALPKAWRDQVQYREVLCELADRLAQPKPRASTPKKEIIEIEGDVSTRDVDVIVNAWNRNIIPVWLLVPQGVSKAIRRAGGRSAISAISRRAPLPLGAAAATLAGDLNARWVVHVAGINMLWRSSDASVRASTRNALLLARQLGARSVALPLIGAGSGGASRGKVKAAMREEIEMLAEHFDRIELISYR